MKSRAQTEIGVTVCRVGWGWIGIAWSQRGLAGLTLPQPTESEALSQLPAGSSPTLGEIPGLDVADFVDKLRSYIDGEAIVFDEPLDPTIGTNFQRRVWAITRAIPRGATRTYGEIAREAGSPGAARAVGQSMARNPWPIVVPCHRVVGHDGRLTGFGGGLAMKQRMLEMEGAWQQSAFSW